MAAVWPFSLGVGALERPLCSPNQGREINSYWDRKGQNEIDLVALNDFDHKAVVAEVKHNPKRYSHTELQRKVDTIRRELGGYEVELKCLSMDDM